MAKKNKQHRKIRPLRALLEFGPIKAALKKALGTEPQIENLERQTFDAVRRMALREISGPEKHDAATELVIEALDKLIVGGPGPVGMAIEAGSDMIIRSWAPVIVKWAYDEIEQELRTTRRTVTAPRSQPESE